MTYAVPSLPAASRATTNICSVVPFRLKGTDPKNVVVIGSNLNQAGSGPAPRGCLRKRLGRQGQGQAVGRRTSLKVMTHRRFLAWLGVSKHKLSRTARIDVSLPGFQLRSKHRYRSASLPVDSTNANRSAVNVISWIASGRSTASARRAKVT